MSQLKRRLIISLVSSIGAITGLFLTLAIINGVFVPWEPLGKPSIEAIELLAADFDEVFVRTTSDMIYSCNLYQDDCWVPKESLQELPEITYPCNDAPFHSLRNLPGEKVDSLEVTYCGIEHTSQVNYVLLDDGSVWIWRHGSFVYTGLIYVCAGSILGLVIGGFISMLSLKNLTKNKKG